MKQIFIAWALVATVLTTAACSDLRGTIEAFREASRLTGICTVQIQAFDGTTGLNATEWQAAFDEATEGGVCAEAKEAVIYANSLLTQ